jgi:hypothetical protein
LRFTSFVGEVSLCSLVDVSCDLLADDLQAADPA